MRSARGGKTSALEMEGSCPSASDLKVSIGQDAKKGPSASALGKMLLRFAGKASGLPADLARNHDNYLHGLIKKP